MKPLPRRIVIRGIDFSVTLKHDLRNSEGSELLGYCERDKGEIYIDRDIPDDIRWATLWHEFLHAAARGHALDDDEMFLDVLAGEIHHALKQMGFYGRRKSSET